MYDELVKRLREMSEWSNIKWEDYSDDAQETMKQAADAIEELSKDRDNWKATAKVEREAYWHWFDQYQKDIPRWIPVTERLPEKCGMYYVTGGGQVWMCELMAFGETKGWINNALNPTVEAWFPIPKPPKEEKIS